MGIQDAVYNLEEGAGAVWVRRFAAVIGFIALTLWYDVSQFHGFDIPEAMDSAQLAREIARGHGFTTHFIRPLALAQLRDHQGPNPSQWNQDNPAPPQKLDFTAIPDTYNAPLYPLALALIFKTSGVHFQLAAGARTYTPEIFIIVFGQICTALTAAFHFRLARNIFDARVGWTSVAVFLLGGLTWKSSISGTAVPLALLLLTIALHSFHRALLAEEHNEHGKVWGWLLGSGAALALASLTDYAALWLLPLFLVAVGFGFRGRWGLTPSLVALWLVLLLPWGVRNAGLTGDLLGSHSIRLFESGSMFPGNTLTRSYRPAEIKTDQAFTDLRGKFIHGLRYHTDEAGKLLGSSLATCLFFAGCFHLFRRRHAQILRYFALVGLGVLAIGASLIQPAPEAGAGANYLFLLWPLTVIFGVAFFFILIDRLESSHSLLRNLVIGLFIAVNAAPLVLTLAPPKPAPFSYPPYFPPVLSFVGQWYQENEVLASDIPWAVAWYTDRPSLWLPATVKEYVEINDYVSPINGLLLTPESRNAGSLLDIDKGVWKEWASIVRGSSVPSGIGLGAATFLPPDKTDYLLISDRNRWAAPDTGTPATP